MSFQESSDSLKAKLHLSDGPNVFVLAGIGAVVIAALGIAIAVLLGSLSSDRTAFPIGDDAAAAEEGETAASGEDADTSPTDAGRIIVVHVSGAVASSGVYELPEGSRVSDAIDAAGGMVDDASEDALNLARVLVDGEQVVVPTVEERMQELQAVANGGASPSGKVNINTATAEQLDTLPGIGESTAQKIIADREANGPFASPEDLKRVSGIGDKKFAELADLITVG